ncbi:IS4 family transposase [Enterococcus cecorum]|uniref:IS4 family transposase n=1 Tax=Enterococcus cecorum TaxID=44008 RepID=UPI002492A459|nr:IS4 family transposase [Enterococcus cecorum]
MFTFNQFKKKFTFYKIIQLFINSVVQNITSIRMIHRNSSSTPVKAMLGNTEISASQVSRLLPSIPTDVLAETFAALLNQIKIEKQVTTSNALRLIDSTTISFSAKAYEWAVFRKTKHGIKIHLNYCYADNGSMYPESFTITNAKEHDVNQLENLIDTQGPTYVFDKAYIKYDLMDYFTENQYYFISRLKDNAIVTILREDIAPPADQPFASQVIADQRVQLGKPETYQTKEYRLVTYLDNKGNIYKFITNRFDLPPEKIAEIYKNRWQIELFFRYIKHQFKITKMYSTKEQGVKNQVYLILIAILLFELVRLRTRSPNTITIIKSYFEILKFESAEKFYQKIKAIHYPPT